MILEGWVIVSLLFGGALGFGVGKSEQKIEPKHWSTEQHREMLTECARQCRKTGALFSGYDPTDGMCECIRKEK